MLRQEELGAVRYALWGMTGWHANYDPCLRRNRATDRQKRQGWQRWVRMDEIMCAVPREQQVEETMDARSDGPERFYGSHPDRD